MNVSQKLSQPWLENKVIISALLILILNGTITFKLQETNPHTLFLPLNGLKAHITSAAYLKGRYYDFFFDWKEDKGEFERNLFYWYWHKTVIIWQI